MNQESINETLDYLEEAGVITSSEKNLRNKIKSIDRSLENLLNKKLRIEWEIKRQKTSLIRKREELKRVTKRTSIKLKTVSESTTIFVPSEKENLKKLQRIDSILLQESNQRLETEA